MRPGVLGVGIEGLLDIFLDGPRSADGGGTCAVPVFLFVRVSWGTSARVLRPPRTERRNSSRATCPA
ncbi:hypothetical protein AMJ71_03440 [candidate division TA06 bacterium SM1_40]|uniref:Uncharacterized protein n=1 Tax=candidate division TA06 bacterium SM1_40 TaxID=1703773 RepID=A0A0S8JNE5_UNCT6|nr:MAG: hypothetical protein AMJ71_03440 [candidate division TA06 bacterium SM1_40]